MTFITSIVVEKMTDLAKCFQIIADSSTTKHLIAHSDQIYDYNKEYSQYQIGSG